MIKVISKKGALKTFYYLMSVDGVTSFEEDRFQELGDEFLGEEFTTIKDEIISSCNAQIDAISAEDERYDVMQENIDQAIAETVAEVKDGVVPRLLIWDMLTLAHCDDDYSENENRLVSHVARVLQIDKSVFVEMKQLISVADSVRKEQKQLELSNRSYAEIRPLVEEVEQRKLTIVDAAKALIEDDILFDDQEPVVEKKENVFLNAGKKFGNSVVEGSKKLGESVTPVAKNLGEKTAKGLKNTSVFVGEKAAEGEAGIKDGAGKLFSKMKGVTKKTTVVLPTKFEKRKEKIAEETGFPKDAIAYDMVNENTDVSVYVFQISEEASMNFDDSEGLIKYMHENMDEHTGLIEVKSGVAKNGGKYIYHIMKHSSSPDADVSMGNLYTIDLNIQIGNTIQCVKGYFREKGMTGLRDNMVYTMLRSEDKIKDFDGWSSDPFDPDYKEGFLMNLSEHKEYDEMFQAHPLSEVRRMVAFIIGIN